MKINDSTYILTVTILDMVTGKKEDLLERKSSHCHFKETFEHNDYIIQLRLDWKDLLNGDPKLDADIWRKPKNKANRLHNGKWHHTNKVTDPSTGRNIYIFRFKDLELRLATMTTAAKNIQCKITIRK